MTNDEAQFSVEAQLENQVYKWANKYKERMTLFQVEMLKISMEHIETKNSSEFNPRRTLKWPFEGQQTRALLSAVILVLT